MIEFVSEAFYNDMSFPCRVQLADNLYTSIARAYLFVAPTCQSMDTHEIFLHKKLLLNFDTLPDVV